MQKAHVQCNNIWTFSQILVWFPVGRILSLCGLEKIHTCALNVCIVKSLKMYAVQIPPRKKNSSKKSIKAQD